VNRTSEYRLNVGERHCARWKGEAAFEGAGMVGVVQDNSSQLPPCLCVTQRRRLRGALFTPYAGSGVQPRRSKSREQMSLNVSCQRDSRHRTHSLS